MVDMSDVIVTYDFSGLCDLLCDMFKLQEGYKDGSVGIHDELQWTCGKFRNHAQHNFCIYLHPASSICYAGYSRRAKDEMIQVEHILEATLEVCSNSNVLYRDGNPTWTEVEQAIINWWEGFHSEEEADG